MKNKQILNQKISKITRLMSYDRSRTLMEQEISLSNIDKNILRAIADATTGLGTNTNKLVRTLEQIKSLNQFKTINSNMSDFTEYSTIEQMLQGEMGIGDYKTMLSIENILNKIGVGVSFRKTSVGNVDENSIKITIGIKKEDDLVSQKKQEFYRKWPCLDDDSYEFINIHIKDMGQSTTQKVFFIFKLDGKFYAVTENTGDIKTSSDGKTWGNVIGQINCEEGNPNYDELTEAVYIKSGNQKVVLGSQDNKKDNDTNQSKVEDNTKKNNTSTDITNTDITNTDEIIKTISAGNLLIKKNNQNNAIPKIKTKLKEKLDKEFDGLGIDINSNTYDDKTVGIVAYYQAKNGLKVDGIIGKETINSLFKKQ